MSKAARRKFQDSEKVAILKRHLVERVPVSDLCDEYKLYPNQFYDWLKKFFENGHLAFAHGRKPRADEQGKDRKIEQPALFISGTRDLAFNMLGGPDPIELMRVQVPHLQVAEVLEGCGHWTQQERPAEVNALLIPWLKGL